MYQQL